MASEQKFNETAEKIRRLKQEPTDQEKLKLYGLYKQATAGNNDTACPGMLDFKGKAKWSAWNDCKGMSCDDARKQYSEYAETILKKYPS